jgi:hypothetical protein
MPTTSRAQEVIDLEDLKREVAEQKQAELEKRRAIVARYKAKMSPEKLEEVRAQRLAAVKRYEAKNPERRPAYNKQRLSIVRPKQRARLRKLKEQMVALKGGKCIDCNGVFPAYAYDFHHVDGKDTKSLRSLSALSRAELFEELNKCVLLCAICHRGRHVIADDGDDLAEY